MPKVEKNDDKRSKKFIFVPFCVLAQAFQANTIVKGEWSSTIHPIIECAIKHDVNIIQLPCPESSCNGFIKGLNRKPAGLKVYGTPEFKEHCSDLVDGVISQIEGIISNGYDIRCIMGIELSPTCAIRNIYSNMGMLSRRGVFMEELYNKLQEKDIDILFVPINRKNVKKCVKELESILADEVENTNE